jgi:hypothetical protein
VKSRGVRRCRRLHLGRQVGKTGIQLGEIPVQVRRVQRVSILPDLQRHRVGDRSAREDKDRDQNRRRDALRAPREFEIDD